VACTTPAPIDASPATAKALMRRATCRAYAW